MQDDERLLSIIPEYLPLGIFVYDKNGKLTYANSVALAMFGVNLCDILGANIFDDPNIIDEDKERLRKDMNVSFETNYDFDRCRESFISTSIIKKRKYFVTRVTIMHDEVGNRKGYLLNCEDITEKKHQELKIIESYKKIEATQQELSLALNTGHLISWDYNIKENAFYKFKDSINNSEKIPFNTILENIYCDDKQKFLNSIDNAITGNEELNNNIILRAFDFESKEYRHYNFVYSINKNENADTIGITFIQRDITEDVIYNQNLILAKNKAEEADKLKSTFLATMSHEIRTPLNAIVGFSQLLSDTDHLDEKNEYKQLIEANSEILLKLIGDILDLSKIEAGSIDINRQNLDLATLCQDLYMSFKQRIKNPNVSLKLINPYQKCIANLDRHRFTQIFTNFVTNAIKYTPSGEIIMGYKCLPGQVRFYVKDNGIGIPDTKKNRIFSRFEKLDDFAQGSGLGLSICKAIANATGADIGFESIENVGSEFWYIGYTEVDYIEKSKNLDTKDETPTTDLSDTKTTKDSNNLNILIAEDNDSNFLLIKTILKGNTITRAINGVEAVENAKANLFDVILMDMKMPIMGGLEATYLIREFNKTIPIIAITANAFNADKDAAFAAGCNHFMTKPINKQQLIETLSTI
ncbi:MAG: response regulator [Muribaculaceae bacterium]